MGLVAGDTVTLRDIRDGVVYFAWPNRLIEAEPDRLLLAQRPGAMGRVLRGYPDDPGQVLTQLRTGEPDLIDLAWASTVTLAVCEQGSSWLTRLFWDAESWTFLAYYVDFVRPIRFNGDKVDTCDLELDMVISEDGSWSYKDQESYEDLRRLGWVSDEDHDAIEAAKPQVISAIETKAFPFDGSLVDWRWPAGLDVAVLGTDWDR